MKELILIGVLLGNVQITSYRSVPSQTDSDPFITASGSYVHPNGVALSRDLLSRWGGSVNYGDIVYVEGIGFKVVNDCLAAKHKQWIDIWVPNLEAEKAFHKKWKDKKVNIWLVKTQEK